MSRKPPQKPQAHVLTLEKMKQGVERLQMRISELEAFDQKAIQKRWGPQQETFQVAIQQTLATIFGNGTVEYKRYERER